MPRPALKTCTSFDAYGDLRYSNATAGNGNLLDVYVPRNGQSLNPLVVFVHGGGWISEDKASSYATDAIAPLVAAGFVCASVNYRYSTTARWPAQIIDIKKAIRALRANASAFRIWPGKVGIWGASAGAHLALMCAATNGKPEYDQGEWPVSNMVTSDVACARAEFPPTDLTNWVKHDFASASSPSSPDPSPVVNLLIGGTVDSQPTRAADASPINWLDAFDVPITVRHGTNDQVVDVNQARRFKTKALAVGAPVTVTEVSGMGHMVFNNIDFAALANAFDQLLR